MRFGSSLAPTTKIDRAAVIALAFADLCVRSGERAGLLGLTRPLATQGVIESFAEAIATDERLHGPSDAALPPTAPARARSLVLLVGDFLAEPEETERALRAVAADGAIGELVMIVDPIEETYPFSGNVEFLHPAGSTRFVTPRAQSLRDGLSGAARRPSGRVETGLRAARLGAEPASDRRLRRRSAAGAAHAPLRAGDRRGGPERLTRVRPAARLRRPRRSGGPRRPRRALLPPARHAADAAPGACFRRCGSCSGSPRTRPSRRGRPGRSWRCGSRRRRLIILAMAQPLWRSLAALAGSGPLLVLIDDGWPAAPTFEKRIDFARQQMDGRGAGGANGRGQGLLGRRPGHRAAGRRRDRGRLALARARALFAGRGRRRCRRSSGFWRASPRPTSCGSPTGSNSAAPSDFARRLARLAHSVDVVTDGTGARAVAGADNEAGALTARLVRSDAHRPGDAASRARSTRRGARSGARRSTSPQTFAVDARFDLPVELRNEAQRIVIDGDRSAGATWLIDDRSRRRRVAIASGASADSAQPLIAPSYYLKRALEPFADVSEWRDSASDPIVSLLAEKPSVLALADMSVAPGPERDAIERFLDDGGVLVRFAGARLAAGDDDLTPTALRRGGRTLGRRAVVGDAQAHRAVREGQPVLRPRRAGRSDGHAAGAGGARGGPCGEDLGAPRRRHAAGHRGAARQGPHRPLPRDRRHHLVEPAAVGPVRRHAAPGGGGGRLRPQARTEARARAATPRPFRPGAR